MDTGPHGRRGPPAQFLGQVGVGEDLTAHGHEVELARSDAGVAALTAQAAAEGAFYNVLINLEGFSDEAYATAATERAETALAEVSQRVAALTETIRTQLRS